TFLRHAHGDARPHAGKQLESAPVKRAADAAWQMRRVHKPHVAAHGGKRPLLDREFSLPLAGMAGHASLPAAAVARHGRPSVTGAAGHDRGAVAGVTVTRMIRRIESAPLAIAAGLLPRAVADLARQTSLALAGVAGQRRVAAAGAAIFLRAENT